jgi:hypothetical protein
VTASSVASAKVSRHEIDQLARALGVALPVGISHAEAFRRCLRAAELRRDGESIDGALEALATFQRCLGGPAGDGATERSATAPPDC